MADRTRIYLLGGHQTEVEERPIEVQDVLSRSEAFHELKGSSGPVYIVDGQVAALEAITGQGETPEDAMSSRGRPCGRVAAPRRHPAAPLAAP